MQKKDCPLAFNGNVSRDLNKTLILVVFGVKLLLENLKKEEKKSFSYVHDVCFYCIPNSHDIQQPYRCEM